MEKVMNDVVNKPKHYTQQPYECIEFTHHLGFCMGNAFKYIWRCNDKNGVEDLKKAQWYLSHIVQHELPLDLDDEIWAYGFEKLDLCQFDEWQERLLCGLWFLAQGVADWRLYDDLLDLVFEIDTVIKLKESELGNAVALSN